MEIRKVTETSLPSDSINNNIATPQDTVENIPMAQELDLKDDMTGLEVEKSDSKVKINNPDEISTASIAETIAADATDINADNIKNLIGLSTSYDTPELNEASEALNNLQCNSYKQR